MAWTEITRPRYRRDGVRYASDTTDEEWAIVASLLPANSHRGRPRTTDLRAVVNGIFYIAQTGCQWRMLPKDFPPFTTVQGYFYRWRDDGLWRTINHHLVMQAREAAGHDAVACSSDGREARQRPVANRRGRRRDAGGLNQAPDPGQAAPRAPVRLTAASEQREILSWHCG